jgi:hypothetical protein
MTDPRLRFRVFVDGQLAAQTWIDCSAPNAQRQMDTAKAMHLEIVNRAVAAGKVWLTEVYDPELPDEEAYTRFGTDRNGMVLPAEVTFASWQTILDRPVETVQLPGEDQT